MKHKIHTLDIQFLNESEVIANYLIESSEGLILIETGPETAFNNLKKGIASLGFDWRDIKHVFITHIHFDHAGAAWKFAENGAKIYVHPIGLPHMNSPERLWSSAKRIYLDDMERLWGEMKPIPLEQLVPVENNSVFEIGGVKVEAFYTPGHAIHHNAYKIGDVLFTGDAAGVKISGGPAVPPCPPPDIDIDAWKNSISVLENLDVKYLYLAHYGRVDNPKEHFRQLREMLDGWSNWIKPYFDRNVSVEETTPLFVAYTQQQLRDYDVSDEVIEKYEKGNPSFMSVTGLYRYWRLKGEGRL